MSPQSPQFFFVPKDFSIQKDYENGFKVDELMSVCNSGIQTKRDDFVYQFERKDVENIITMMKSVEFFAYSICGSMNSNFQSN